MGTALVRRPDLVAEQRVRPPFGRRTFGPDDPPVRVGTTGTGADLMLLAWAETDLASERREGAGLFGRLGIRPEMRVANALPGALATPGALLVGDVNEEIGALDVPLGMIETDASARAAWELLDRVQVNVLILEPARAETVLAAMPAGARPWWQGVVWLRTPGGGAPGALPDAFAGWQREWLAVPEVSSFVAGTCERGGFHAAEAVRLAAPEGELLVATRQGDEAPYATGAQARIVEACSCGAGPALELT
jgi:hypothetical protein